MSGDDIRQTDGNASPPSPFPEPQPAAAAQEADRHAEVNLIPFVRIPTATPDSAPDEPPRIGGMLILAEIWLGSMVIWAALYLAYTARDAISFAMIDDYSEGWVKACIIVLLFLAPVVVGLLALRSFFRRRSTTRNLIFLFCGTEVLVQSSIFTMKLGADQWQIRTQNWDSVDMWDAAISIVVPMIWLMYFNFSTRVKRTFVMSNMGSRRGE